MTRLLVLTLVLGACAAPASDLEDGPFRDLEDYESQRAAAVADLEAAIGTPSAGNVRSCLVLPVGAKACGGPAGHVAYSTETAEVPVLLRLARRVTELDQAANAQFELASDCALEVAPPAALEGGMCVLGE